jgi:hypothetical protein
MIKTPNVHNLSTDYPKTIFPSDSSPEQAKTSRKSTDKGKQNIENFIKLDSKYRSLEKRLKNPKETKKKQEKLDEKSEKFKKVNDRRLLLQRARYAQLQKEREDDMKVLEDKLRRTSRSTSESRSYSFARWREKSKEKLNKIRNEEEKYMLLKLELYNKKQIESGNQHKQDLARKSKKMYQINSKVDKIRTKMYSTTDSDQNYYEAISKSNRISTKQQKIRIELEKKLESKKRTNFEKQVRKNMNISEILENEAKKEEKLKEKHNKSFQVIQQRRNDWENFLELKQQKERLKSEKSSDFLTYKKKMEFKAKQEIISKHHEMDKKLNLRKTSHEIFTQKKRRLSMKQAIERDKIKRIKFFITKSKEPVDASRVLSTFSENE